MKKLIALLLTVIISVFTLSIFSGCNEQPIYDSKYTYNDEYHYRKQLNGTGKVDYAKHSNISGKCRTCDYYFENYDLVYKKITLNGVVGWEVTDYQAVFGAYAHVEIPKYYCDHSHDEDEECELLPVLSIGESALQYKAGVDEVCIESVKLNEGLKKIGTSAFAYTGLTELIIPDSVEGELRNLVMYSGSIKRVVIGNGVTVLRGYCFASCGSLEEVIIGESVHTMHHRNFYNAKSIKYLVIPKSLKFIPESSIKSGEAGYVTLQDFIEGCNPPLYLMFDETEYNDLLRDPLPRRASDNYQTATSKDGWCYGWSGRSKVYFAGEWKYNANGEPEPLPGEEGRIYNW